MKYSKDVMEIVELSRGLSPADRKKALEYGKALLLARLGDKKAQEKVRRFREEVRQ